MDDGAWVMNLLHELSEDHQLRTTPLREIGGQCRNLQSRTWRDVSSWRIGRNTYNDLGEVWTSLNEFRAFLTKTQLPVDNYSSP